MTCPNCKCENCVKAEKKPDPRCVFCFGLGTILDKFGFRPCFCVRLSGGRTG